MKITAYYLAHQKQLCVQFRIDVSLPPCKQRSGWRYYIQLGSSIPKPGLKLSTGTCYWVYLYEQYILSVLSCHLGSQQESYTVL